MTGAESRTRRPILPKLRTPGVRGHFDSSTIRIAGGHHEEGGPNVELVIVRLGHPSLPVQDNLAGYSESDSQ